MFTPARATSHQLRDLEEYHNFAHSFGDFPDLRCTSWRVRNEKNTFDNMGQGFLPYRVISPSGSWSAVTFRCVVIGKHKRIWRLLEITSCNWLQVHERTISRKIIKKKKKKGSSLAHLLMSPECFAIVTAKDCFKVIGMRWKVVSGRFCAMESVFSGLKFLFRPTVFEIRAKTLCLLECLGQILKIL